MSGRTAISPNHRRAANNEPRTVIQNDDLGSDLDETFLTDSTEDSNTVSTRRRRKAKGSPAVRRPITPPPETSESGYGYSSSNVTPKRRVSATRGPRSVPVPTRLNSTRSTGGIGIGPIAFENDSSNKSVYPDRGSPRNRPRRRKEATFISPPHSPQRRERQMTPATVFTNGADRREEHRYGSKGGRTVFGLVLSFAFEVFCTSLSIVRKPLGYLVALYIFVVMLSTAGSYAVDRVFAILSPLCHIPGVATLNIIPYCQYIAMDNDDDTGSETRKKNKFWTGRYNTPDYPQLINLQNNFEEILGHSAMGSAMALNMKNAEISIRDLSTLVRISDLVCREELALRLGEFVQAGKAVTRDLTRYGARVDGVVDNLLAMDEYALRSLESLRAKDAESSNNPIVKWVSTPFRWQAHIDMEKSIAETFLTAAATTDTNIQKLILETEILVRKLQGLDETLNVINEMVLREDGNIKGQAEEVLAELWTILGGNRKKLANYASHRELLANVRVYRAEALKHVSRTLVQLYQMSSSLEELRERVALPTITDGELPLEVHIESIRMGVERLTAGRYKARKLEEEYGERLLRSKDTQIHLEGRAPPAEVGSGSREGGEERRKGGR